MTTQTATNTVQVYQVYIKATPQAIWDAITKPEWTEKYGYGGRGEFDLRPGGAYRGYTSEAMKTVGATRGFPVPDVAVDGEVIEVDPPRRLVQTFRMLMDQAIASEGFTRLTYEIEPGKGGVTKLTVTHDLDGAPRLAVLMAGGLEEQGAGGGWSWILSGLKSLLETGTSLDTETRQG
jgi:uncharacterized protein YndB with AHSA1/START domain